MRGALTQRWGELLALLAGAIFPLGFAPFAWRPLSWLSIAVLFYCWQHSGAGRSFLRGWLWGLGAFLVGISWVYNSMHDFGGAPSLAAALFTLVFAMYLALYPALAGGLWRKFYADSPWGLSALALGLLWALSEWLRAWVMTGFPWLMSGFSLLDTPLAGFMPWLGSLGSAALAAVAVALLVLALQRSDALSRSIAGLFLFVILVLGAGLNSTQPAPGGKTLDVALVQGNVPQAVKMRTEYLNVSLQTYVELSEPHLDADLLIWPETAMPTYRYALNGFLQRMAIKVQAHGAALFTGIFLRAENGQDYYNAMLEVGGDWQSYKKHQLVPFGEYMPIRWLMQLFSRFVDIPKSDMSPAPLLTEPMVLAGAKIAASICYEMAYPDVLRAQMQGAQLLVNTSNDAWFGDSLAAHQHLEMARTRAREFAKPIARATNNGITAFIDARGDILAQGAQFVPLVIRQQLSLSNTTTLFTQLGQNAVGLAMLCLLFALRFTALRIKKIPGTTPSPSGRGLG